MLEKTVREPLGAYMRSQGIFKPCLFDWDAPLGRSRRSSGALGRRPGEAPGGLQEGVGVRFGAGVRASMDVFCLAFAFFEKRAPVEAKPLFFRSRGVKKQGEIVKTTLEVT